jgi:predicted dehydrogenase
MSKGGAKRIRVGIIGANPDRGWAAQAHIPALTSLSDDFEIAGCPSGDANLPTPPASSLACLPRSIITETS